jgi:hypothetical protein
MLIPAIISVLVGAALGLRFNFFILVPTVGLALAVVAVTGIALGNGIWRLVATMVVVAAFLQLGYIGGSVLRFIIGAMRATDHSKVSMPTSAGVSRPAK